MLDLYLETTSTTPIFLEMLLLMGSATALITLFLRLRIASLLAFIIIGAIFGPTGLQLVDDPEELADVAELGLTFLLFLLGLEFSLPRLIALRRTVFRIGTAQVFICTLAFTVMLYWWGLPLQTTLILAAGLSLSSTAIVSRELGRLGQLNARHGEIAIGILLFQDLVAVALLIAVPLLAGQSDVPDLGASVLWLLKTIALLLAFFALAKHLLPRVLEEVSRHKSDELLVLTALVIVLLCAYLTELIGLSKELGAFLGGMMLGESRFRHQLEADVRPFRDLLLGLFFITIGMLVDLELLATYWLRIVTVGVLFVLFKAGIIVLVGRLMKESWQTALPAGLALAQGGEFLFALLALASRGDLVPDDVAAFLISVTIVSMMMTPLVIRHGTAMVTALAGRMRHQQEPHAERPQQLPAMQKKNHVVILGFGRVGQSVARFLRLLGIEYVVLESDTVRVAECAAAGEPIFYGNTARRDILKAAAVDDASLIIISFDHFDDSRKILEAIRELNPRVPILTRTRDDSHLEELTALGATEVIPETHEASLTLASHALLMLNVSAAKVEELVSEARRNRYRLLQGFYHGEKMNLTLRKPRHGSALHAVVLTGAAWACGRSVQNLQLPGALKIKEVHRQHARYHGTDLPELVLQNGDVVILEGPLDMIRMGAAFLLRGQAQFFAR